MKRRIVLNLAALLAMTVWSMMGPALSDRSVHAQTTYHLLIIAPDDFVDELQPLKRFKDATARPTILVSLSQVYGWFPGEDNAEKIKRCIAYYAEHFGVEHVLLAGDVDKLPVRWRWWGRWMPDDDWFRGEWSVVNGKYRQSDSLTENKPFGAWVYVIPYDWYTVEADVTRIAGQQIRLLFADAERHKGAYRLEIHADKFRVLACSVVNETSYTFTAGQSYHVKVELTPTSILVYVDGVQAANIALGTTSLVDAGKVGVGTFSGSGEFDNFRVTSRSGAVLWEEDFDDGTADGFTDGLTMEERGWAVSDLYYADLFKSGTVVFDDWDANDNGLHGEIEFQLPTSCPDCTLNNDSIDYLPDVSVGRIPASDGTEISRYVNKAIAYELATLPDDTWFKRAALYEGDIGAGDHNDRIETYLAAIGFDVSNRPWAGDLENLTPLERKQTVIDDLNGGAGFVSYIGGHGNFDRWAAMNFYSTDVSSSLTNEGMLPIAVAGTCLTSRFAPPLPPADAYTDLDSYEHLGDAACEPFPGDPDAAPATLQSLHDLPALGEDFSFNAGAHPHLSGAIAYLGESRAGQVFGKQLVEGFLTAYSPGIALGDMWREMITDYYWANSLYESHQKVITPSQWLEGHKFDEPQKFVLFGDPSIVVGGAFSDTRSGTVWDGSGGPWVGYGRYRVVGEAIVPLGQQLTIFEGASVLFEDGSKITALGTGADEGLILNATTGMPVYFLSLGPDPQSEHVVHGMKVLGQVRVRSGGQIRLH